VPDTSAGDLPPVSIEFGAIEWREEVERYDRRSPARSQAQSARRTIEGGTAKLDWKRCKADGPGDTKLPGCRKLYVPLGKQGAAETPYGFVFQLIQKPDELLAWNMIAFGERHSTNERTHNVYERAHKRLPSPRSGGAASSDRRVCISRTGTDPQWYRDADGANHKCDWRRVRRLLRDGPEQRDNRRLAQAWNSDRRQRRQMVNGV
jgi:hypothetical protein